MVIKFFIGAQQVMSLSTGLDDDTDLLGVIGSIKWMPLKKKTPKQKESSPDQENPTQVVSQQ
ncbi:hypothetical protein FRB90_000883 [Tulasnella sp. 427]|nr:hypothetical protein FRB90_000883 [Tulasnella sp. 427]